MICYELLDELIDFGYPQTTDAKILQEYITQVIFDIEEYKCYTSFVKCLGRIQAGGSSKAPTSSYKCSLMAA